MRVISGKFGKRSLRAVPGRLTRPTTDKVKESLFNMIGPYFDGGNFLDLFAGSGGVAIEAVSRGFNSATLVDKQYAAIKTINENIKLTREPERFNVYKMTAESALNKLSKNSISFDMVFLDPPYKQAKMINDLANLSKLKLLNPGALVICETDNNTVLADDVPNYQLIRQKEYGLTVVSIYKFMEDD
ncbi:16S rRNA (guanine(966)-N(2))-methyltransferase RsmD [Nicoliella spurrieriana]|uniref:16S rRNA (Guanine(966)-N(2))-methyltransferase RsmD n=1 Tax=Nicoliella spurrieriana TaxID=2925830 RepID=A0A976RRC3_9LACO|nr:16S rRNA (guanine(966)-N(2))-methyltransferase RsmD [Nicoliella spurrieriana]UQS86465.1 16S rRNA (guanine(966)-N(2))-methyltransferase RsmD [Nicoliella spurrieriana]